MFVICFDVLDGLRKESENRNNRDERPPTYNFFLLVASTLARDYTLDGVTLCHCI